MKDLQAVNKQVVIADVCKESKEEQKDLEAFKWENQTIIPSSVS